MPAGIFFGGRLIYRLPNNIFIRENYSVFTTLSRPEVIDEARSKNDPDYKYRIIHAMCNMETQFKYCLAQELEIMNDTRKLCKMCISYYDHPSAIFAAEIRAVGNELYRKMCIYDYADWQYIKGQAKSRAYNKGFLDFDKIYHTLSKDDFTLAKYKKLDSW